MTTKNPIASNIIEEDWKRGALRSSSEPTSNLVPLDDWRGEIGRTNATIWRWRQKGMLPGVINISGRLYIHRQAISDFERRAADGEFAKEHIVPKRSLPDEIATKKREAPACQQGAL